MIALGGILGSILYILLFILCLSCLIVIHELGHLIAAKSFKVYCHEFGIGFGPKLISVKKPNQETRFSLRAIPFGGFVSMYADESEITDKDAPKIDPNRSLKSKKPWKRATILIAGVAMNAVLAFILFFVKEIAFVQKNPYVDLISVTSNSNIQLAIRDAGIPESDKYYIDVGDRVNETYFLIDSEAVVKYKTILKEDEHVAMLIGGSLLGYEQLEWKNYVVFAKYSTENPYGSATPKIELDKEHIIAPSGEIDYISYSLNVYPDINADTPKKINCRAKFVLNDSGIYTYDDFGISMFLHEYRNSYGEAVKKTFSDFGNASTAVAKGFVMLFTSSEARESAGGIIAIGFETTSILKNFGIEQFIYIWGLISVNLAIVNLFPFPGLDGWQLLVLIIESISKKEINPKAKSIASIVGIVLLFILMGVLVVKDVLKYII